AGCSARPRDATARGTPQSRERLETPPARPRAALPEGPAFRRTQSRARDLKDSVEGFADGESIGLDEDRVAGRPEGRDGAFAIELVTAKDLCKEVLPRTSFAAGRELFLSAARALGRRCSKEHLALGLRQHDGPDIAADHDDPTALRDLALLLDHRVAHLRDAGDLRHDAIDVLAADRPRHIGAVKQHGVRASVAHRGRADRDTDLT